MMTISTMEFAQLKSDVELIGMLDSPFVRRVAITLNYYQQPFTLIPLSVYSNPERLAAINPLLTVPVLRFAHKKILGSQQIMRWIEERTEFPALRNFDEHQYMNALAASDVMALKAGELYREKALREKQFQCNKVTERLLEQISAALNLLEASDVLQVTDIHHASISIATSYGFVNLLSKKLEINFPATPKLTAYCAELESFACFKAAT
jgi:glutathione S-transferase